MKDFNISILSTFEDFTLQLPNSPLSGRWKDIISKMLMEKGGKTHVDDSQSGKGYAYAIA